MIKIMTTYADVASHSVVSGGRGEDGVGDSHLLGLNLLDSLGLGITGRHYCYMIKYTSIYFNGTGINHQQKQQKAIVWSKIKKQALRCGNQAYQQSSVLLSWNLGFHQKKWKND